MQYLTKWLNKRLWIIATLCPGFLLAQSLTMQQVYDSARQHYPATRQKKLVQQTANLTIDNLSKGNLPQVSINGQASYQSDVTSINIPVPGINIEPPSKDQYKITADVSQVLYDGGLIKQQQQLQSLHAAVEDQKVEVELYQLKQRINQVYISILYIDEQLKQVELVKVDLNTGIKKVQAQVDNGVALKSNVDVLRAELLKNDQHKIELTASRKGMIDVLGLFMQQSLPASVELQRPLIEIPASEDITRPELDLYAKQNLLLQQQNELIKAKNLPKASAFVQGGYGRPGLNLLKNSFEPYGIGGLRVNWPLGGLYTAKKEKQLVEISKQSVDVQKETFLLNTQTQVKQQESEISKFQQLIFSDRGIIELRVSIKNAANAQLENGVITANDYLREVNAEDQARQLLITHQLQLLQAKVNLQLITGK
jgi:outer membrane protein TolC